MKIERYDDVAFLVEHLPEGVHVVISTRADPTLPLSRLRVRGDLAELRADNLRFSAAEAVEFFSSRLGALLSEQDVLRLLARTEGWAAGLQLAALRLRDRPDRSDFIERLTGADWHIVNYLGEEVLERTVEWRHRPTLPVDTVTGQGDAHMQWAFSAHRAVVRCRRGRARPARVRGVRAPRTLQSGAGGERGGILRAAVAREADPRIENWELK